MLREGTRADQVGAAHLQHAHHLDRKGRKVERVAFAPTRPGAVVDGSHGADAPPKRRHERRPGIKTKACVTRHEGIGRKPVIATGVEDRHGRAMFDHERAKGMLSVDGGKVTAHARLEPLALPIDEGHQRDSR